MSQKFVPLITCDITFDQNYTSAWNLLKTFIVLPSTYIRKVNIRHAFLCLLSRSEAVRALSGILKSCSVESGILPGLFKPFFQILHGLRSWIFIDNFIHYAPKILHKVDIWGIRGQHVFSIKFDRFFLHHAWVALAACAGAPSWTNVMWRLEMINFRLSVASFTFLRWRTGFTSFSNMLLM